MASRGYFGHLGRSPVFPGRRACQGRAACRPIEGDMESNSQNLSSLAGRLTSADWAERFHAAFTLAQLGCLAGPAVPALIEALRDDAGAVRNMAIRALGNIGPDAQQAAARLSELLSDEEPEVRGQAATALGQIGGDDAAAALEKAYADEDDEEVQEMIAAALAEIDGRALDAA
jgi:HEAT repeat protein